MLQAIRNRDVVPVEIPGHNQPATLALLHWVPGTAEPAYQQPGVAEDMGAATAYLHDNAATVELPDFDRPVWDVETILVKGAALTDLAAREQLSTDGFTTLREVAERITPVLSDLGGTDYTRIHGDLHRENMIALPDGSVGVIDFDDCGTGHPILDIATVLSSIHRIAKTDPGDYDEFAGLGFTRSPQPLIREYCDDRVNPRNQGVPGPFSLVKYSSGESI